MYRFVLFLLLLLTPVHFSSTTSWIEAADNNRLSGSMQLYLDMQLSDRVSFPAFEQALFRLRKDCAPEKYHDIDRLHKPSSKNVFLFWIWIGVVYCIHL